MKLKCYYCGCRKIKLKKNYPFGRNGKPRITYICKNCNRICEGKTK